MVFALDICDGLQIYTSFPHLSDEILHYRHKYLKGPIVNTFQIFLGHYTKIHAILNYVQEFTLEELGRQTIKVF